MIRGTLTEFSLPDVIRLVSETHKTGILEITGQSGTGQLLFIDGCVCGSRTGAAREPLGRKLIRRKAVSESDLWRALDDQTRTHQRLGQALIAAGSTTLDQVQTALREQIEDGAVDILALQPTEFTWTPEAPDEQSPVLIPPDSFLTGVSERVREIEEIRARIPATDEVLSMNPSPPGEASSIAMSREEWRMLTFMGARRTVRDLLQYSGSGDIHTLRALDRLIAVGLLELGASAPQSVGGTRSSSSHSSQSADGRSPRGSRNIDQVIRLSEDPGTAASAEPFTVAIVATSNRPQSLLGAAILRKAAESLPVHILLLRLDDLGPVAPSAEALLLAEELGVDLTSHPSRQLRRGELSDADLVVGLDWWHVDRAVLYGAAAREKAFTIAELLTLLEGQGELDEPRLMVRARALVGRAHEERLMTEGEQASDAKSEDDRHSIDRTLELWSALGRVLFSTQTVEEIS
jgi:protein-tyrosine-phosphatase